MAEWCMLNVLIQMSQFTVWKVASVNHLRVQLGSQLYQPSKSVKSEMLPLVGKKKSKNSTEDFSIHALIHCSL